MFLVYLPLKKVCTFWPTGWAISCTKLGHFWHPRGLLSNTLIFLSI